MFGLSMTEVLLLLFLGILRLACRPHITPPHHRQHAGQHNTGGGRRAPSVARRQAAATKVAEKTLHRRRARFALRFPGDSERFR